MWVLEAVQLFLDLFNRQAPFSVFFQSCTLKDFFMLQVCSCWSWRTFMVCSASLADLSCCCSSAYESVPKLSWFLTGSPLQVFTNLFNDTRFLQQPQSVNCKDLSAVRSSQETFFSVATYLLWFISFLVWQSSNWDLNLPPNIRLIIALLQCSKMMI